MGGEPASAGPFSHKGLWILPVAVVAAVLGVSVLVVGSLMSPDSATANATTTTMSPGNGTTLLGRVNGVLLVASEPNAIVGISETDGETIWDMVFDYQETIAGTHVVDERLLISVQTAGVGETQAPRLISVDTHSGDVLWIAEGRSGTILQWTDPVVLSDVVVVMDVPKVSPTGDVDDSAHLLAFDSSSGSLIWAVDLEERTELLADSLIAGDASRGILIAVTPTGTAYSVDPVTGAVIWRAAIGPARILSIDAESVSFAARGTETSFAISLGSGELVP